MSRFNRHGCSMPASAGDHRCMSLELDGAHPLNANDLFEEVISSAEFYRDSHQTTVWIDIHRGPVPANLIVVLSRLKGSGYGVVITHEESMSCSHAPGALLPKQLVDAASAIKTSGHIWHPYAQQLVYASAG